MDMSAQIHAVVVVFFNSCNFDFSLCSLQFYSHIKKELAHVAQYLFPHRHDHSHLRRRH